MDIDVIKMNTLPCSCTINRSTVILAPIVGSGIYRIMYVQVKGGVKRTYRIPNNGLREGDNVIRAIEMSADESILTKVTLALCISIVGGRASAIYLNASGEQVLLKV